MFAVQSVFCFSSDEVAAIEEGLTAYFALAFLLRFSRALIQQSIIIVDYWEFSIELDNSILS